VESLKPKLRELPQEEAKGITEGMQRMKLRMEVFQDGEQEMEDISLEELHKRA
jgi:hypothetical protein